MKPAAFKATFVDQRRVAGRKVHQFVFEVPAEEANAALTALGGLPDPANAVWVAIARIDPNAAQPQQPPHDDRQRRRFAEMPAAAQIAMTCQSATFREYLRTVRSRLLPDDASACENWVKGFLGVASKREVIPGTDAFAAWAELRGAYEVWLKYERSAA